MHNIHGKNCKSSPLKTYYLSSILPFDPTIARPKQIPKTKDFYKPEQFIWNNPHRTSKRMYPYYHRLNDTYVKEVKPEIDRLEQHDRRSFEFSRIRKLSHIRNQTRQKFYSRKKLREDLESKAGSRRRKHSMMETKTILRNKNYTAPIAGYPMTQVLSTRQQKERSSFEKKMQTISSPERSFIRAVQQYDQNLHQIGTLACQQISLNHNKVRQQFQKRKKANDLADTRIKKGSILITKQIQQF